MLTITSPRVARALVAGRLRSRRRAAWGSFTGRTHRRRIMGSLAATGTAFPLATIYRAAGFNLGRVCYA